MAQVPSEITGGAQPSVGSHFQPFNLQNTSHILGGSAQPFVDPYSPSINLQGTRNIPRGDAQPLVGSPQPQPQPQPTRLEPTNPQLQDAYIQGRGRAQPSDSPNSPPINPQDTSNIPEGTNVPSMTRATSAIQSQQPARQDRNYYRPLYLAAQRGDWKRAKSFIFRDRNALTARITDSLDTILHVAAKSCQWRFVLKLLELLSPESIALPNRHGTTAVHYVAQGGSLKTAKALVEKNPHLLHMANDRGIMALNSSILSENKELVWYFALKTNIQPPLLPTILRNLNQTRILDVALHFVQKYPELALANDEYGTSLLFWLSSEPSHFFSGSNLGFFKRWIYKFVHINMEDILESTEGFRALQRRNFATQVFQRFKRLLWQIITQLAPSVKMVRDEKLKHECAVELVNNVCMQLSSMSLQQIIQFLRDPRTTILATAVSYGIEEIVRTLLQHFPDLSDYYVKPQRNILQVAIEHRQEKIVNILKEISPIATKNMCGELQELENTTLHLAGKLAPTFKLYLVSGAALQMQRELQWFKEVEKITFPDLRERKNQNNKTAKDVFRIAHKRLAAQGEKWMKGTANSCMLVATLIATVLFAAAFTVPGGNVNDKGIPFFLRMNAFMVFAISDALGLFSSLTSLLMFLGILTARYTVEDFLESLPKKLIIGLGSLFVAIAAMIITFGATLTIVLSERWHWVSVPITLLASFPMAIFVMLQLPLFIQIVQSTYASSIIRP